MKKLRKKAVGLLGLTILMICVNFISINAEPCTGVCIANMSEDKNCIFETDDVRLNADIGEGISSVIFSYKTNGTYNMTGTKGTGNSYYAIIPKSNLIGGINVLWEVYAANSSGYSYTSPSKTFSVKRKTKLTINPLNPDGTNQWYITKPLFTLENPDVLKIYYRWNGNSPVECGNSCSFGLDNTPNNGNSTGGILKLVYWGNANCGAEKEQNKTFKIDLTNPAIIKMKPKSGEVILNNPKPEIYAYIDEIYQSNSGIRLSNIIVKLDGSAIQVTKIPIRGGSGSDSYDAEIRYIPPNNLVVGNHTVYIHAEDNSGRVSEKNWTFSVLQYEELKLDVISPIQKDYTEKKVLFNISTNNPSKIESIDYSEKSPKWKVLCSKCNEYIKLSNFKEGNYNITIRAVDDAGTKKEKNISFAIDLESPVIKKTFPEEKKFSDGTFSINFIEENPEKLVLTYGNDVKGYTDKELNLNNCSSEDNEKNCAIKINLSNYDSQVIEYWFNLTDRVGKSKESKPAKINVDLSKPVINYSSYIVKGKKVKFFLEVFESNLYKINLIDYKDKNPGFKILCTKLKNNVCEKDFTFRKGEHNVTIEVLDKAGNKEEIKNMVFMIV